MMTAPTWQLLEGQALDRLCELPDESVHCVVTSPPYWGLRDYGVEGQIGLEPTFAEFLKRLVEVFSEVHRVLRTDGVCWVNMGDSYAAKPRGEDLAWDPKRVKGPGLSQKQQAMSRSRRAATASGFKEKDLIGQPWRLAFALQDAGWWLRSEVIWHKATPMPESVTDRPTRAHEHLFLLTKAPRYFYDGDAIREPLAPSTQRTWGDSTRRSDAPSDRVKSARFLVGTPRRPALDAAGNPMGANRRTVWRLTSQPYPDAHFATFPPALVEPCILAGTSEAGACSQCAAPWRRIVEVLGETKSAEGRELLEAATAVPGASPDLRKHAGHHGDNLRPRLTLGWEPTCEHADVGTTPCVVLDPFAGAATTLLVAQRLGRSSIGIELNPEYSTLGRQRVCDDAPLLNTPAEVVGAERNGARA